MDVCGSARIVCTGAPFGRASHFWELNDGRWEIPPGSYVYRVFAASLLDVMEFNECPAFASIFRSDEKGEVARLFIRRSSKSSMP